MRPNGGKGTTVRPRETHTAWITGARCRSRRAQQKCIVTAGAMLAAVSPAKPPETSRGAAHRVKLLSIILSMGGRAGWRHALLGVSFSRGRTPKVQHLARGFFAVACLSRFHYVV
jgi:hypothetical protein